MLDSGLVEVGSSLKVGGILWVDLALKDSLDAFPVPFDCYSPA